MKRCAAIAATLSALPVWVSADTDSEALTNCAALVSARYSDPQFSQQEYSSIPLAVSLLLEIATGSAKQFDTQKGNQPFKERDSYYRARLGKVDPVDAEAGNLPDWAVAESALCDELIRGYKVEMKALIAKRLEEQ